MNPNPNTVWWTPFGTHSVVRTFIHIYIQHTFITTALLMRFVGGMYHQNAAHSHNTAG